MENGETRADSHCQKVAFSGDRSVPPAVASRTVLGPGRAFLVPTEDAVAGAGGMQAASSTVPRA